MLGLENTGINSKILCVAEGVTLDAASMTPQGAEIMATIVTAAQPAGLQHAVDARERIIVALDVPSVSQARNLVDALDGIVGFFKIGPWLQLEQDYWKLIDEIIKSGKDVFIDTKGCDIPETMRGGISGAARRGIRFLTIHGNGEVTDDAIRAAVEVKGDKLKLFLVTVLTSLDSQDLEQTGYVSDVANLTLTRAERAKRCMCDGVIASGLEVSAIKEMAGPNFLVTTPGIRPAGSPHQDQKRAVTPDRAIKNGSDFLVVGRPIIHASNPAEAAGNVVHEMQQAFDQRPA